MKPFTADQLPARSATYNQGGELFDYLRFMLLELEPRDGQYVPVWQADGQPRSVVDEANLDYYSEVGRNSVLETKRIRGTI